MLSQNMFLCTFWNVLISGDNIGNSFAL